MNILFVTHAPPSPPTDGARVIMHNLARVLSARHTLYLATFADANDVRAPIPFFAGAQFFLPRVMPRRQKWAYSFADALPLWVRAYASPELRAALSGMVTRAKIDVVHLDTGMMAQYADALAVPTVLAPHDALSLQLQDRAKHSPHWWARAVMRVQYKKMLAYEKKYYPRATCVCVVTAREQEFLQTLAPRMRVRVIPNGVDTDFFAPQNITPAPHSLGFLGAMDYAPNQTAVMYFAQNILPRIWRAVPDATFTIIGRNPAREIYALAGDARIRVTGTVDDVRPHVAAQSVMVCPILAAGGIKNKLLEALAMGKAVVATRAAAQGASVRAAQELFLAEDENNFAAACVQLLNDAALRECLGQDARAWALTQSWQACAAQYEALYAEAITYGA